MEKRIIKKLLAIFMIITLLATDFFVLGSGLITYATELNNSTSNSNIEFSVYFENGENEIQSSITNNNLKLYAEIKVNSEDGYLFEGTTIGISESNFNVISTNNGTIEETVEGTIITLNQKIDKAHPAKIELGISPKISDITTVDFLSKISTVKLNGKYKYSLAEEGETINATKNVSVQYIADTNANAELISEIVTNDLITTGEGQKRIVQILIKSRLQDNQYPVKQTILNVVVPKLSEKNPEKVNVLAANGRTIVSSTEEPDANGNLKIVLTNNKNNEEINWYKNGYDEVVVTLMYPNDVTDSIPSINVNSKLEVYNSNENLDEKFKTSFVAEGITTKLNNMVMANTEITTEELYKGQLYANSTATKDEDIKNIDYETKTTVVISNKDVSDKIVINEGPDEFGINEENKLTANTQYKTTKINLTKMKTILGEGGSIEIKYADNSSVIINKDTTPTDDNGNVIISHPASTAQLQINVTPGEDAVEGILEINHTKQIVKMAHDRETLQTVKTLDVKNTVTATLGETKILENSTETSLTLKETISKAELKIENRKTELSTTEANELILGVTLVTDGVQYDLYKEPTITIQMPESVESVEFNTDIQIQQGENKELTVNSESGYNPINKTITIKLDNEQTSYPESDVTQAYIQLDLRVTLSQFATTKTEEIIMNYTNKNAIQYDNEGVVKQNVLISGPGKLVTLFNINSNNNTSLTETITQHITSNDSGKDIQLGMTLINDTEKNMKNIRILGKLPTTGNTISEEDGENTLETTLQKITGMDNATIYYTDVANATTDLTVSENRWTTDMNTLTSVKLYLIILDTLNVGENCSSTITIKLPDTLPEDVVSYTSYEVIYDTDTEINKTANSRKIGLITSLIAGLEMETTAQVGLNILNEGDTVKEGEIIKYTVTIKNKTGTKLEGLQLNSNVPDGTVLVEYEEASYEYIEKNELKEITETISLEIGEQYTKQYEVRVTSDATSSNSEIANETKIIYDNSSKTKELTNKLEDADIRVTITSDEVETPTIVAGTKTTYNVRIENLSDKAITGLKMQIMSENKFDIIQITESNFTLIGDEITSEIPINEVPANGRLTLSIYGMIKEDITELNMAAVVEDTNNEQYRSNLLKQEALNADATISLSSSHNNANIKEGDKVTYNITVKNIGNIDSNITVSDIIPNYLKITKITIGDNVYSQTENENDDKYMTSINNDVKCYLLLAPGAKEKIIIETVVNNILEEDVDKIITNTAEVSSFGVHRATSEEVKHTLKINKVSVDEIKNRISGFVWLDTNSNGQKDSNENYLEGIIVKLYDITINGYFAGESGNIISLVTDVDGEYTFTKIPNGSYIVVIETDEEKYEPTTASVNQKAEKYRIIVNGEVIEVIGVEISNLQENTDNLNIGLKEQKTTGEDNDNGNNDGDNEDIPGDGEDEEQAKVNQISGNAWLDLDRDGQRDDDEKSIKDMRVRLYDVSTKNYLLDSNNNIVETKTDENGKYIFKNIKNGLYVVLFEFNVEEYEPTIYLANGVDTTKNSKVALKTININNQEQTLAVTDTINVQDDISNINIGLKEKLIFDLELNKYISRIVVQNKKGTKAYDYEDKSFAKVEIHKKQLQGSLVVLEYTIKVKNNGEMSGYVKNIVDYLPSGLTFSSELNTDWYLSGDNLYTKSLENVELKPGEEKEVKLILTKTMSNENTGLINNRAEIYQDYNKYGEPDIDSTPNNLVQDEDDISSVDVIIGISTGGSTIAYVILLMINIILIGIAIKLMIKNNIIKISTKKERR